MMVRNYSLIIEFILTGIKVHPDLKIFLCFMFPVIYLVTIVGNLSLMTDLCRTPSSHIHDLMDICCSWYPKMLENFLSVDRMISLYACTVQFYFLCVSETADCFLLVVMRYDLCVAICNQLKHHTMMSKKHFIQMNIDTFIASNLCTMIHVGGLLQLTFCKSNCIDDFCDILYRLFCTDPFINEIMITYHYHYLVSYFCITFTIFKMKSMEARREVFSTCASHFLSVSVLYICLLMYVGALQEWNKDIPVAVFYSIAIPLLNPFIYSRRNKEFLLMGFTDHSDLKILLLLVFSAIHLVTTVRNLSLVTLIYVERHLCTSMYIFLGNLALMDSCCSCATTPKIKQNFFLRTESYFLCLAETADCFLLAAMAYDRYVAICNPLQYHTMMSKKLCLQMTTGAYIAGALHPMINIRFCSTLFSVGLVIKHFFVIYFHCIDS
ncbi:hypothetical protein U0070_014885, partial [Myodes glareolus]